MSGSNLPVYDMIITKIAAYPHITVKLRDVQIIKKLLNIWVKSCRTGKTALNEPYFCRTEPNYFFAKL